MNLIKTIRRNQTLFVGSIFSIFLTFGIFYSAFSAFFFQDDWFSLSISRVQNFFDILKFFIPRPDLIYYRPLGMQVPFFIFQYLFGINPLPFRIATFLLHLINGFLVYKILYIFINNKNWAKWGALLYLTSSIHMIVFYWAATFAFVLAPLLYFWIFILYTKGNNKFGLLIFIIGLLTNELLLSLPLTIFLWEFLYQKSKNMLKTITYFVCTAIYLIFRLKSAYLPLGGNYALVTNIKTTFIVLRNYFLWVFQWPEETANQFMSFVKLNPLFFKIHITYMLSFLTVLILAIIIFLIIPGLYLIKNKKQISDNIQTSIFGLGWFFITLSPVLFFSQHAYSYYLPIPFLGILIFGLSISYKAYKSMKLNNNFILGLCTVFTVVWVVGSMTNIHFNQIYHWAPRRAEISGLIVKTMKQIYPTLPQNAVVVIPVNADKSDNNRWALNDQQAFKIVYNDTTIKTYYGKNEELNKKYSLWGMTVSKIFVPSPEIPDIQSRDDWRFL